MSDDGDRLCGGCGEVIDGRAMKAKDKLYHDTDKCFSCVVCGCDLRKIAVYAKDGELYCDSDYKERFVSKCARCDEYITENCVRAMDKTWHAQHFSCHLCSTVFTAEMGYHEHERKPFCEPCYMTSALPQCKACSKPITDKAMKALGGQWHVQCFVCKDCKSTFEGHKSFYSIDDLPICGPCAGIKEDEK